MGVYVEAQHNQLVTEFDIQSQAELEDHQVQLADVDNPTQAQDNLVIGGDGVVIPHWNESVDFDTWVKIHIENAGRRVLMIHGNDGLIGVSSIDDTMIFGDDFSDDLSKWEGNTSIAAISDGILTITGTGNDYKMNGITDIPQPYIVRFRANITPKDDYTFGLFSQSSFIINDIEYYTTSSVGRLYTSSSSSRSFISLDTPSAGFKNYDIVYRSGNVHIFVNDVEDTNSPKTTNVPNVPLPIGFRTLTNNSDWLFDYIYARQYAVAEPTYTIGSPKNISIALKSLGRVG